MITDMRLSENRPVNTRSKVMMAKPKAARGAMGNWRRNMGHFSGGAAVRTREARKKYRKPCGIRVNFTAALGFGAYGTEDFPWS
ncbi:hypothetical protein TUM18999_22790 [Pseudomonas tohonis]|uniref:Uncharacterized protein n=1 Tax=Pseudomonas tohonis TaxID=2725477 RepID=A0A6J4E3P5_9PSED|nr:hypothetical protein TUM18999_22790 [Pseudomonas tohonis]GJN55623.1 hypothetical protein TUM20286_53750 [Pseudomonas tohonis]